MMAWRRPSRWLHDDAGADDGDDRDDDDDGVISAPGIAGKGLSTTIDRGRG